MESYNNRLLNLIALACHAVMGGRVGLVSSQKEASRIYLSCYRVMAAPLSHSFSIDSWRNRNQPNGTVLTIRIHLLYRFRAGNERRYFMEKMRIAETGPDDDSSRPLKRPRADHVRQQRTFGPHEPYVLLSEFKRWWEVRVRCADYLYRSSLKVNYDCNIFGAQ